MIIVISLLKRDILRIVNDEN